MAAPFLIALLLIASGATAAGDDGARELPHLELPGTPDSGPAHGSDAPPPPPPQGLMVMDIMSMSGCGRFADLLAATRNASDFFQQRLLAGGADGRGLTVFCPDDKAVAGFTPTFRALADKDRLAVLLHHGAAGRFVRPQLAGFDWVAVPTLAVADAATNRSQTVLVRDAGDTMWLWPTWPQDSVARVTKTFSPEEAPLVLYVIDAVLLRQKLDGGGDEAAACGGYLGWVHCCIPLWAVLFWVACFIAGYLGRGWWDSCGIKDAVIH